MVSVYDAKEINFTHNGIVVLNNCITCNIDEELNGLYELELEYIMDERGKWQYLLEGNIIKVDSQLFRIYHKIKTLSSVKINARHIFYDLLDNFLEDCRPTNLSGAGALDWVLTHTQYAHSFTSTSDVGGLNTRYFVRKNVIEAIMGTDGIINTWGGELVRNNFGIELLGARGLDRGVLVAYSKNIQGIEETLDIDSLCTRLMPIGKDGLLLSEKYIDSPYINNFAHPIIKVVELNDCETQATLLVAGQKYMLDNKIDIPTFNYKIDFLELSKTEEYKNYAVLERVYMADTVTIKHSKLNIDLKAKVIKITKNILTNRIDKIELGSFKPNLATSINNSIQEIKKDIVQVASAYQLAIDNATSLITGTNGGNVLIDRDESGKPYRILIMDTTDVMTATNVWCWSIGGFGHSSTGINGPYETAITMDGSIVGKFITALIITGDQINGGTIKGVRIQQISGALVLADLYKDPYGGKVIVNDLNGAINASLGSESKSVNVGGTLSLYDDAITKERVKVGITATGHGGYVTLRDTNNVIRCQMNAENTEGSPQISCCNSSGVVISAMVDNGFIGLGRRYALKWNGLMGAGNTMVLTHNLGYYPIVSFGTTSESGPEGSQVLKYQYLDANTVVLGCYGAAANVFVSMW